MKPINKLPEWWYIRNSNQEIRDWFASKYDENIKSWDYKWIGYCNCRSHGGVLGTHHSGDYSSYAKFTAVELSFEDFKRLVLQPKPEILNEYTIY